MANKGPVYGLDAELAAKQAAKFNPQMEAECRAWLEAVLAESSGSTRLQEWLKSGVRLCTAINRVKPNTVKKINTNSMAFMQMENLSNFLAGCKSLGVIDSDLFSPVDLYEEKNWPQVIQCIHSLGRVAQKVPGYTGPKLGVKEAERNERNFSEDVLNRAKMEVPLTSKGSHGGATQSGMFDGSREIIKKTG
eukprot:TRINITY_DN15741_c0_g1_i1.p1 TRINITY_DN15741_c0_g1~~TRINITY_DN15741_c0_g1_i1.p1  ORF type:complete len:192 (-),score=44.85 TRINITY_DN15741_c0_g1_i1:187-762(-)